MLPEPVFRSALVDADESMRRQVRILVEGIGGLVNEAQDVEALGILLMGASTFDVIVADLGTLRSSGVAFIAELRSRGNTTPIVLLSDDAGEVRRSLRRGDGVLVVGKPSTPSALKQAVLASVRIPSHCPVGGMRAAQP